MIDYTAEQFIFYFFDLFHLTILNVVMMSIII